MQNRIQASHEHRHSERPKGTPPKPLQRPTQTLMIHHGHTAREKSHHKRAIQPRNRCYAQNTTTKQAHERKRRTTSVTALTHASALTTNGATSGSMQRGQTAAAPETKPWYTNIMRRREILGDDGAGGREKEERHRCCLVEMLLRETNASAASCISRTHLRVALLQQVRFSLPLPNITPQQAPRKLLSQSLLQPSKSHHN